MERPLTARLAAAGRGRSTGHVACVRFHSTPDVDSGGREEGPVAIPGVPLIRGTRSGPGAAARLLRLASAGECGTTYPGPVHPAVLPAAEWRFRAAAHRQRMAAWLTPHRERRERGEAHPVLDFLFTYYSETPGRLLRWHPGAGIALAPGDDGPAPHAGWRWYAAGDDGTVALDRAAFVADRGDTVRFVRALLAATASRPAATGCFGLHEWAMVYRADDRRHPLPLRLGPAGTDAVVEAHPIRCTHYDAFRFFTPPAAGRNRVRPTRTTQVALEQPGCLHATMDLYKWAYKLGPAVPGELLADCFALAAGARELDMRASPYDLRAHGYDPVAVETPEGRARYVAEQRRIAGGGAGLRARLLEVCEGLLEGA